MFKFKADNASSAKSVSRIRSSKVCQRRYRLLPPGVSALLVFLATACSGGGSDPVVVSEGPTTKLNKNLTVEPSSFILSEGEQISLKGKLGSTTLGASQLSWSVSPSSVASIDSYGNLTALKHGDATVTARYTSLTASANATVWAIPHVIEPTNGLAQAGIVGRSLVDSLGVRAVSEEGVPVPGVEVRFDILSGEGTLSHAVQTTGLDGVARVDWKLGGTAGNQEVKAQASGLGELAFVVEALPDYDSATVLALTGDDQTGEVTTLLPEALTARVTDQFGNLLPGLSMEWSFSDGGGIIGASGGGDNPQGTLYSVTDDQGLTQVMWRLGTVAGDQEAICAPPASSSSGVSGNLGGNGPSGAPPHDKARGRKWRADAEPSDPNGVVVTPEEVWTVVGEFENLTADVVDPYGNVIDGSTFNWKADDSGVVQVESDGNVVGLKVGTAQVTAESTTLNLSGTAVVIVETRRPSKLNRGSGNGQKGKVGQTLPDPVGVQVLDQVGTPVAGVEVTWTVMANSSASGSAEGSPTLASGETSSALTVTDNNGIAINTWILGTQAGQQSLKATVEGVAGVEFSAEAMADVAMRVSVEPSSATISVGGTKEFTASAQDAYGNPVTQSPVDWTTSNGSVANVSSAGVVTGLAAGTTEIRATVDGISATAALTVSAAPEAVTSVQISPSNLVITGLEKTGTLEASAENSLGEPVADATFQWTSLNPTVAIVSPGGVVTSKALGQVLIVASVACCSATDTVLVEVIAPIPAEVVISPNSLTLYAGETESLSAVVLDSNGAQISGASVTWASTNPDVATVSPEGMVIGTAEGTAEISAEFEGIKGLTQLSVIDPPPPPSGQTPELPRLLPDTVMPTLTQVVTVTGNLQAALDAATPGTRLVLQGTFTGNFLVRNGSGVQIEGGRLVTPNQESAIRFQASASRWKMVGTEIESSATSTTALVSIDSADRITLQDVQIHGHDGLSVRRCVLGNGTHISVLNSSLTGCHIAGYDSQAFVAWNGAGPYWLQGNVLEGAGENVMFGGADSDSPSDVPADITIRNNTIRKPPEWFTTGAWTVKNLFEIKTATRVLVENNLFENTWPDAQSIGINIKSVNQGGGTGEWSKATDITFRKNTIRNVYSAISLAAAPEPPVAEVLSRVLIEDNLFENGGEANPYGGAPGARAILILGDIRDLTVQNNEWYGTFNNQVVFEGTGKTNFIFRDNIVGEATYGFQNAHRLTELAPGAVVEGNILAPAAYNLSLPSSNCITWPPSNAAGCSAAGRR